MQYISSISNGAGFRFQEIPPNYNRWRKIHAHEAKIREGALKCRLRRERNKSGICLIIFGFVTAPRAML